MSKFYSLTQDEEKKTADLYIFGDIVDPETETVDNMFLDGGLGFKSSLGIVHDLQGLEDVEIINVHINSMGGYTDQGVAIYNTLKACPATVNTYCDGMACSAASYVFMAGDNRYIGDGALLMIHNAWREACGNAYQLRQQADELEKISKSTVEIYVNNTNLDEEQVKELLEGPNHDGTWLDAAEALEYGFATEKLTANKSAIANQSVKLQLHSFIFSDEKKTKEKEEKVEVIANIKASVSDTPAPENDAEKVHSQDIEMQDLKAIFKNNNDVEQTLFDRFKAMKK